MAVSGNVIVDGTDIGCSEHFLIWMEIGRVTKRGKKVKRVLRRWRLERFDYVKVKVTYQKALQDEVLGFTESVTQSGMKGEPLVQEVVHEWEEIVTRVAKSVVGEKAIVCGKSARWWDNKKIIRRRKVYKKVISGRKELWDYYRLRKEVKEAVREKKFSIWSEVVEKVNADFEGSRKEFWAFVGRRTKGKYKNITSLKSKVGVSVSSMQGKLEVLRRHPIAYASMALNRAEKNYSITKLETLAVVWGVSHFRTYLYGNAVKVLTAHSAVKLVLETSNPTGKHARWWTRVYGSGGKSVTIVYCADRDNVSADALSRSPCSPPTTCGHCSRRGPSGLSGHRRYHVTVASRPGHHRTGGLLIRAMQRSRLEDDDRVSRTGQVAGRPGLCQEIGCPRATVFPH